MPILTAAGLQIQPDGEINIVSPLFADGRSWKFRYSVPDYENMTEEQILNGTYGWLHDDYVLHVEGDTMADGCACRKIVASGPWGTYLYALGAEEPGKVMLCLQREEPTFYAPFPANEWVTLYDFNVARADHCHMAAFPNADIVSGEGIIHVGGTPCRFILLGNENDDSWKGCAIEGIGCPWGLYVFENIITNGSSSSFIGCYDGEVYLFSRADFDMLYHESVGLDCHPVMMTHDKGYENKTNSNHYDLQGRRLTDKPQKGVYVKDGRKYVK